MLEHLLRTYYITGGMPEAVEIWSKTEDVEKLEEVQQRILDTIELDFAKFARTKDFSKLFAVWNSIPAQLTGDNSKFMFGHAKKGMRAKDLEDALEWLINAGLAHKVFKVEEPSLPVTAYIDFSCYKLYMVDCGLMRKVSGIPAAAILEGGVGVAELLKPLAGNYVLSELINIFEDTPYFWRSGNTAEIDFLIQYGIDFVPIEIKSGNSGRTRSLGEYRKKYAPACSVKTTLNNYSCSSDRHTKQIYNVPLYLLWKLESIIS
jgi:predicted AAA+ superfamily ATPase